MDNASEIRRSNELKGRYERAQAARLRRYAPDTRVRRVRWSGGETSVLDVGSGPPLLYLHGELNAAFEWIPMLPGLARIFRVIAVDRPGHGLADPFDYEGVDLLEHAPRFVGEVLDALQLRTVNLVGNSLGGLYALLFAIDEPERVSGLVLSGALVGVRHPVRFQPRVSPGDRWQRLKVPTVLLWGQRDAFATRITSDSSLLRNTQLRLVQIPDAGHLPWLDHPHAVLREIINFLAPSRSCCWPPLENAAGNFPPFTAQEATGFGRDR